LPPLERQQRIGYGPGKLFRTEIVGWIDEGRADDAQTDGEDADRKGDQTGQQEDPPGDGDAICKVLQPAIHAQESDRGCEDQGDAHQHHKFFIQQEDDVQAELYSINGKLILRRNLGHISQGLYNFKILNEQGVAPGVYILKIIYVKSGNTNQIKVLKQ